MHFARRKSCASMVLMCAVLSGLAHAQDGPTAPAPTLGTHVVFGYNDLGMHCMNRDCSELLVLPPFNNLHAQVIRRGEEPDIITSGVTVRYTVPGNTHSSDKSNFWTYAPQIFGVTLAPNIGLTGHGLSGTMTATTAGDWEVTGIPITPTDDSGRENPYPLATITVIRQGSVVAQTQAVVPVSWEMSCNLCHTTPGISVATDILRDHDRLHGTTLEQQKPVLCAGCHADPALGTAGQPGVSYLSHAMHGAHAPRMAQAGLAVDCYACHPGIRTSCQRDVHFERGYTCSFCHGNMAAVADTNRTPWADQPRCGSCHTRPGFQFEQTGKLFKDSVGHKNIRCSSCHGSPHAITPTVTAVDNVQALAIQGHTGPIDTCTVCHIQPPSENFFHKVND